MSNLDYYDPIYIEEDSDDEEISKMKYQYRQERKQIKKLERQYYRVMHRKRRLGFRLHPLLTQLHL